MVYLITEHRRHRVADKMVGGGVDGPEDPLRRMIGSRPHMAGWQFIDDGLGGGALVDPNDPDHCFRADPREDQNDV